MDARNIGQGVACLSVSERIFEGPHRSCCILRPSIGECKSYVGCKWMVIDSMGELYPYLYKKKEEEKYHKRRIDSPKAYYT